MSTDDQHPIISFTPSMLLLKLVVYCLSPILCNLDQTLPARINDFQNYVQVINAVQTSLTEILDLVKLCAIPRFSQYNKTKLTYYLSYWYQIEEFNIESRFLVKPFNLLQLITIQFSPQMDKKGNQIQLPYDPTVPFISHMQPY